jgi:nicotinate-nucleotide adenylyltransferase
MSLPTIGLFGGTFDPVHCGHIQMALAAKKYLKLDEVRLLPCHQPPHRDTPQLSSQQRLLLLKLAVSNIGGLAIDDRELKRDKLSWTVDTLKDYRKEFGDELSITLLMGVDAYNSLQTWHEWQQLPTLAHVGVLQRPEYIMPKEGVLADWLASSSAAKIHTQPSGMVIALEQPQLPWSATTVREQLALSVRPRGLPKSVLDYIVAHQLYGFTEKEN